MSTKTLIVGGVVLAVAGVAFWYWRRQTAPTIESVPGDDGTPVDPGARFYGGGGGTVTLGQGTMTVGNRTFQITAK